jgi:hypothetical protein
MGTEPSDGMPRTGEVGPTQQAQPGIVLVGGAGWTSMPIATSPRLGLWMVYDKTTGQFPGWATLPGVRAVPGNFSGVGWTAIALLGGPDWETIPMAVAQLGGSWMVTNEPAKGFSSWSKESGVTVLTGDFAKTGKTAIALTGHAEWSTMPLALSNGDGSWAVSNTGPAPGTFTEFPKWAAQPGVTAVAGDFSYNGTPRPGIALVGGSGWETIPMAFAQLGEGNTWLATNPSASQFAGWAAQPGVKVVTGKFSNSGLTDIALLGPGWVTIPVAFANADGSWTVTNERAPWFVEWATTSGVKVVTGKFGTSGLTDIALLGNPLWSSIPVAFAYGDGNWICSNYPVKDFPGLSSEPDVTVVPLDFSVNYHRTVIALTGGSGWSSIPIAISSGDGKWSVNQNPAISFPGWAATADVRALPFQGPTTL